ncbi:hypothetical protein Thiosp_01277 [Thiorhodovibrio litoralis]|nr:hypothetical protein Thiosp_01277 [Thiorhodovibrio litoralis]
MGSYFGSKATSGLCQPIIALMPPHDTYIETHLGGGAIMQRKPPALRNIAIERNAGCWSGSAATIRWSASMAARMRFSPLTPSAAASSSTATRLIFIARAAPRGATATIRASKITATCSPCSGLYPAR